jgi:PilZ domain-containing protein
MKIRTGLSRAGAGRPTSEPNRSGSRENQVDGAPSEGRAERRRKPRFPFALDVRYRTLADGPMLTGAGQTINMSRSGLLIASEHEVPVGARMEVTIEWPVCLGGTVPLKLVTSGRVTRSDPSSFVVLFRQYEFRTTKRKPASHSGANGISAWERSAGA